MKRITQVTLLMLFLVAVLAQAQIPQQTPSGFFWPTGSSANTAPNTPGLAGLWLEPDELRKDQLNTSQPGRYKVTDKNGNRVYYRFHIGFDILNPSGEQNHPIYAIADGVVIDPHKSSSWGSTSCSEIKQAFPDAPSDICQDGTSPNNVGLVVMHKKPDGTPFYAIYGHMIDVNMVPRNAGWDDATKTCKTTSLPSMDAVKKADKRRFRQCDVIYAGEQIGVTGYWNDGRHLHFGIAPYVLPTYPLGIAPYNDTLWPSTATQPNSNTESGTYFHMADPINWIMTQIPYNWLSLTPVISQTAMPPSITLPLGGVGIIPWNGNSLQGFTGTIQGNTRILPSLDGSHLKISTSSTLPQVLGANQTVPLKSMVYLPSTLSTGNYAAEIRTMSVDNSGNLTVTAASNLTIQAVLPPAPPSSGPTELFSTSLYSDANLMSYYRFEGNSTDSKGGHNGTDTNVTYGASYGKFGQGALFNGTNSIINTGNWNIPTAFSISGWVYLNSLANLQTLFSNSVGSNTGTNVVQLFVSAGSGEVVYSNFLVDSGSSTAKLTANAWHHVAVTHDGSTVKIYIDGVFDHQASVTHTTSSQVNCIGRRDGGWQPLNGRADDLAVFNRVLTDAEISNLYNGSGSVSTPVVSDIGTAGGMTVGNGFTVYTSATSVDPTQVQGVLLGPSCPSGCVGTLLDATTTSYVGNFPANLITQSGAHWLQLRNGSSGSLSNSSNTFNINSPLSTPSCSVSPTSASPGTPVTFTAATPSGGWPPYTYYWDNGVIGNGSSITTTYTNGGYVAAVDLYVADYLGNQVHTTCGLGISLGQPTINALTVSGTASAGSPFGVTISGTNYDQTPGNLQVWFCQDPGDTVCYQQPAGISVSADTAGSQAVVTGINLSAGNWVAKIRNTNSGAWSNLSGVFTVAAASGPTELYNTSLFSGSSLLAYWRFEGNSSDSKGGHNGTDTNASYSTSYGKFGQGVLLNGNGSINVGSWQIPTTFSISSWVYLNSLANLQTLFSNYSGGGTGSNVVQLFVSAGDGSVVYSNFLVDSGASTAKLTTNAWHHVAVTHNGTTVKIYIDGVLDHQASVSHSAATQTNFMGKRGDGYQPLTGNVDDLAIFSRELTATEISNLCNGGGSASPSYTFTTLNSSQTVQAGSSVGYGLNLTPTNNFTNSVTVFVSGLPTNTTIASPSSLTFSIGPTNGASFTLTLQTTGATLTGTYTLTLHAQGGGVDQYLYPTLTVTAPPPGPLSISCYLSPNPINLGSGTTLYGNATGGSGGYLYNLNNGGYQSSSNATVLPNDAGTFTYTAAVKDSSNSTASTSCSVTVNGVAPSNITYTWDNQPVGGVNFSGYVYGNAITPSATVWFYGPGCSNGCQQPPAGVSVQSLTIVRVTNVNITSGTWQVQVRTAYGSATSGNFTVN